MKGFDPQYTDLPDYILKCTAMIWEGRDIAALDWHYSDDLIVRTPLTEKTLPDDVVPQLNSAIKTVISSEAIVLDPARAPGFNIDKLEEVWAKFEAART